MRRIWVDRHVRVGHHRYRRAPYRNARVDSKNLRLAGEERIDVELRHVRQLTDEVGEA